jgi:hypothetical protein
MEARGRSPEFESKIECCWLTAKARDEGFVGARECLFGQVGVTLFYPSATGPCVTRILALAFTRASHVIRTSIIHTYYSRGL